MHQKEEELTEILKDAEEPHLVQKGSHMNGKMLANKPEVSFGFGVNSQS